MDVNIDTKSRIIREQVFKEQEPRNYKTTTYWEKEEKLKKRWWTPCNKSRRCKL